MNIGDTTINELEPSPVWLQRRRVAILVHERAIKENWSVSRLVDECLAIGAVPIVNYIRKSK